jgi:hypothetical protein
VCTYSLSCLSSLGPFPPHTSKSTKNQIQPRIKSNQSIKPTTNPSTKVQDDSNTAVSATSGFITYAINGLTPPPAPSAAPPPPSTPSSNTPGNGPSPSSSSSSSTDDGSDDDDGGNYLQSASTVVLGIGVAALVVILGMVGCSVRACSNKGKGSSRGSQGVLWLFYACSYIIIIITILLLFLFSFLLCGGR